MVRREKKEKKKKKKKRKKPYLFGKIIEKRIE